MDHFWLNEGFTTWAERRILDALHGEKSSALRWAIGQAALDESVARFGYGSPLTKLRTDLQGVDPDDAFSSIPYEKGSRFVCVLELEVGRDRFDRFMQSYIQNFRFTSRSSLNFWSGNCRGRQPQSMPAPGFMRPACLPTRRCSSRKSSRS
jgi:aminopeptidase N